MDSAFDFKSFDLFGVSIPVSYENNYLYKTKVGATLTIISFIIIAVYTLLQISTLLDRSSYTVSTSESQDLRGEIDLSNTPIMFDLLDLYWNPVDYDPKLFTFSVIYTETTFRTINGERKRITINQELETERCDKLKKDFKVLDELSQFNLTKYWCIKPNQSLVIYGSASDIRNDMKSLSILVSRCNNETNECSDFDTINNILEKRIFAFIYLGYTTNFTNINNGKIVEYKTYMNYLYLSKHLHKEIIYDFSKCKLNLYDTFFITHKTEINYFSQNEYFRDYRFIEDSLNYVGELIRFNVMYSGYLIEYSKTIKGIGPTFSYIMAVFNTVIIVVRIFNDYYGNKILLSDLFQLLKIKNISLHNLNKYKVSTENDISKKELISKMYINNIYGTEAKGKLNFNSKKSLKQNNNLKSSVKSKDMEKIINCRYSKNDYWKFYVYPYCLIKKNRQLHSIQDEICSIFSIENILETIKLLGSFNSLKNEFQEQAIQNEMIINNASRIKRFNDCEERSKFEIVKFSELMNDK